MGSPLLVSTRDELAERLAPARREGAPIGLVPTMGALHEGHASLVREARRQVGAHGRVVVSVFVNPLQFGPDEDLDRYPRTLPDDLVVCEREGADLVYAPGVEDVYPLGVPWTSDAPAVTVDPGPLATVLEGRSRPGHFRGVLTVVAKLLGLVGPDVAVFGQKDYQQLVLIRRMVADLCLPVRIVGAETVREPDGLALSSRNRYLDAEQRAAALALSRALHAAVEAAHEGRGPAIDAARAELRRADGVDLDYLELADPDLAPLPDPAASPDAGRPARLLVAARVGSTRLIDNLPLTLGRPDAQDAQPAQPGGER
ncbi:pantoate--beta-alanine ligase [Nocardioides sp. TRM66260-LWL]|uniref:pantoate--beta-alanine ligase n=1 Tax=Nocardioides sp. TRM66260-LWL TaxID=2874478 RepID=UPI001CC46611|nr:pantoate--beta-alanine ligase [Nocardioides sp. TRM66260-LWL]MBZ5734856.1 pantoate--beta-alanine ligase [Nocardioides sp. TRM66260-LWL]